jgi:outer membrane protein assembly factor BamD
MLAALCLGLILGCAGHAPPPPREDAGFMDWARATYQNKEYGDLSIALKQYLPGHAGSRYTEEATLLLGKTLYELDLYEESEEQFRSLLHDFPGGEFAPEATYYLGLALYAQSRPAQLDQKETNEALAQFRSFVSRYPNHPLVPNAEKHILAIRTKLADKEYRNAELYRRRGLQRAARIYYTDRVLKDYGDTKFGVQALLGLAESYAKTEEWYKCAPVCQQLLDRYPKSIQAYRAKDLLEKARRHGAVIDTTAAPALADSSLGP